MNWEIKHNLGSGGTATQWVQWQTWGEVLGIFRIFSFSLVRYSLLEIIKLKLYDKKLLLLFKICSYVCCLLLA